MGVEVHFGVHQKAVVATHSKNRLIAACNLSASSSVLTIDEITSDDISKFDTDNTGHIHVGVVEKQNGFLNDTRKDKKGR